MSVIKTDLRNARESARRIRFEKVSANPSTDVQNAIEYMNSFVVNTNSLDVVSAAGTVNIDENDPGYEIADTVAGAIDFVLPTSASRQGKPIVIIDAGGVLFAHNATLTPQVGESIRGMNPYMIDANWGMYVLYPRKDNLGYSLGEQ